MYAPDKDDKPLTVEVNGFAVRAWKSDIAETSTYDFDGVTGTARASDSLKHDWVWITVDGAPLPDLGTDCFLRVTDGEGRVIDSNDGQNVELAKVKTDEKTKTEDVPVRAVVFRLPARWSWTPDVTLELYSQRVLLASWTVAGVPTGKTSIEKGAPLEVKADNLTFVADGVVEYSTQSNGALDRKGYVDVHLEDPEDRDLRWVAELTVGQQDPLVVVGRGKVAQRVPVTTPVEPGTSLPLKAKFHAFSTQAAISYYVYCSMKEQEDGSPEFRSGANVVVNLAGGGKFSVSKLMSTGQKRPDGSYDFSFPCRWTVGGKTLVGRPLGVGGTVPAILRSTRGTVVPTLTPQDTFTLRMSENEVEYLKGGRFTFELWLETRKLIAQAESSQPVICRESPLWTQRAALARSDEMTHAGE